MPDATHGTATAQANNKSSGRNAVAGIDVGNAIALSPVNPPQESSDPISHQCGQKMSQCCSQYTAL